MSDATCRWCGKGLRRESNMPDSMPGLGYSANGFFCTLRCGFRWAVYHAAREER